MPKKNKTLCVDDLRHAEYYGMQPVFDELYHRSLEGENFTDLMDLILSLQNTGSFKEFLGFSCSKCLTAIQNCQMSWFLGRHKRKSYFWRKEY